MRLNNTELLVVVNGRPITEYLHNGQIYIEGREGSDYEIRFHNNNPFRVEAVISVDGLSILDGKEAGDHSSGYLIEANDMIAIPGWKVDGNTAAHFAFGGKKGSYATTMTGSARNNGVIGVKVFKERYERPAYVPRPSWPNNNWYDPNHHPFIVGSGGYWNNNNTRLYGGSARGIAKGVSSWNASDNGEASITSSMVKAMASNSAQLSASVSETMSDYSPQNYTAPVEQVLGTEYGHATEFKTTEVEFKRGDLVSMMVMFYDERNNLIKRGVPITRPSRQKLATQPQAFPASTGAPPPPGWTGRR